MANTCALCNRGATRGASRSHSNIQTLKRQKINLQTKNIAGGSLKICTRCIKTAKKISITK